MSLVLAYINESTLIWGQVERGIANKGDDVEIVGLGTTFKTTLTGIGALVLYTFPLLN